MARARREKSEFGSYIVELIHQADMVQSDFYDAVGIKKPYFYDIVTGKANPPPQDTLDKMIDVLERRLPPDTSRRNKIMDLAAKCRGEIPADINQAILNHPEQWDHIRELLSDLLAKDIDRGNLK